MTGDIAPMGGPESNNRPARRPLRHSPWFWAVMASVLLGVIAAVIQGANAYFYPCTVSGDVNAYLPCEVSDGARWFAVFREGLKGLGCMCCPLVIIGVVAFVRLVIKNNPKAEQPPPPKQ